MQKPAINYSCQRGVVLFVGLIFLIILTLMAIVAMKSSSLQEKLTGGAMDQGVAFQATESALRDAEQYINSGIDITNFSPACTNGLCLPSTTATSNWDAITDWTASAIPIVFGANTGAVAIPDVAIQPRYIIEILPDLTAGSGGSAKSGGKSGTAYRITAMGWGKRSTTPILLQSVYVKV